MRFVSVSHELKVSSWLDGKEVYLYKPRMADNLPINTVSWGKNGAWVLLCQSYAFAEIISLGDEAKRLNSIQNVKNTTCADFQNISSRRVALGTSSGQLVIYDLKAKSIKQQCATQKTQYFKVQHTIKDTHVLGACKDGRVYVYRTNTGNLISTLTVPNGETVTNFRCHPAKANLVGLCSAKGVVAMWDYNVEKPSATYEAHRASVADVLIKHDHILSIGADRRLVVMDYRTKKMTLEKSFAFLPTAFDLHADGVSLAVGMTDGLVYGFDLRTMAQATTVLASHTSKINQVLFDNATGKPSTSVISEENTCDLLSNKSEPIESFSAIYCDVPDADTNSNSTHDPELEVNLRSAKSIVVVQDSFMDALSLCSDPSNGDSGSISRVRSIRRSLCDSKVGTTPLPHLEFTKESPLTEQKFNKTENANGGASAGTPATNGAASLGRRPGNLKASTPINYINMQSPIYPINAQSGDGIMMREEDIRRIVREELSEMMKETQSDMFDMRYHLRQATLGLQWSINKMCVNFEEQLEKLRRDLFQQDELNSAQF